MVHFGNGPFWFWDEMSCSHIKNNSYSFRYQNIAELPQIRTPSYGLQSFRYAGTKFWNALPNEFRKQSSLNQFKTLISSWSGSSCQCFAYKTSNFLLYSYACFCMTKLPASLYLVTYAWFWFYVLLDLCLNVCLTITGVFVIFICMYVLFYL